MIEQYKINEEAENHGYSSELKSDFIHFYDSEVHGFKAGVKWAEGRISEDLMSIINLDGDEYTDGEILDKVYEYLDRDNND